MQGTTNKDKARRRKNEHQIIYSYTQTRRLEEKESSLQVPCKKKKERRRIHSLGVCIYGPDFYITSNELELLLDAYCYKEYKEDTTSMTTAVSC